MSEWAAKRFWKVAGVEPCEGGFAVALDGRRVKTPAKAALVVPSRALAEAIAAEWDAQEEEIRPQTMPMTRAANAAIDKVAVQMDEVVGALAEYGTTDLLCYRADAPEALVARQAAAWDPLLDWAGEALGARLVPVTGVMHAAQDDAALANLRAEVAGLDAFELTALHDLVGLPGSLVIGLAALKHAFELDALWQASLVDELWQEEQWGPDEEAQEMRAHKGQAFADAGRFLRLVREG
jgi:chaperone required for assembly of F1-ATPase